MKPLLLIRDVLFRAVYLSCLFVVVSSCAKDDEIGYDQQQTGILELQLNIFNQDGAEPAGGTSLASASELEIKNGYVFVFTGAGAYRNHGVITTADLSKVVVGNKTKNPKLLIPMAIKNLAIDATDNVVLVLNQIPTGDLSNFTGYKKSEISTRFPLDSKTTSGFRPALELGNASVLGVPMYGEATGATYSVGFTVVRSLAKIQIKLSATVANAIHGNQEQAYFTPANVKYQIYNNALTGKISPPILPETINYSTDNIAPISAITESDAALHIVKEVTLANASNTTTGTSYIYEYPYSTNIISASGTSEQEVANKVYKKGRLAIILRVKQGSSFKYYHLSLYNKTTREYLDIERNHNYQIIINSVDDAGYDTATEALISPPSNIKFDIIDFNPIVGGGNATIVSNDQYAISIGHQFYAGKTVYLDNKPDVYHTFEICSAVKYTLSPSLAILPADIPNTITCTAVPEGVDDNKVTITLDALEDTDQKLTLNALKDTDQKLTLHIPNGYTGTINYTVTLGELDYSSADIDGATQHNMSITIDNTWNDDNTDGTIDDPSGIITAPSRVLMNSANFPNGGFTSGAIAYKGGTTKKPEPVRIYLPINADGSAWSEAVVTVSDFNIKFNASTKQTWLASATLTMTDANSGSLTFTHAKSSIPTGGFKPYIIKLQSGNVSRLMSVVYGEAP